jgi:hypothetical protein
LKFFYFFLEKKKGKTRESFERGGSKNLKLNQKNKTITIAAGVPCFDIAFIYISLVGVVFYVLFANKVRKKRTQN